MSVANHDLEAYDEIKEVWNSKPHLILLGAGASRAAFPMGEASGKRLPLMVDFMEIVPIKLLLASNGIKLNDSNFEVIYGHLKNDISKKNLCRELENIIYDYFSSLSLPDSPTLYDHLILSLRKKDVIATFNWDPFLIQAYQRNEGRVKSLPVLLFLHGNVASGYCLRDNIYGTIGGYCKVCGNQYTPSQLLYPIENKDYNSNPDISGQWKHLEYILKNAFIFTIFGYGAPASDAAAIDFLSTAWGKPQVRELERVEIIDLKDRDELRSDWDRFIHTHHFDIYDDFYNSWIANHPRRTIEANIALKYGCKSVHPNPIPKNASFPSLWDWINSLIDAEKQFGVY